MNWHLIVFSEMSAISKVGIKKEHGNNDCDVHLLFIGITII